MVPSESEVREQSLIAYNQWCAQWRDHAQAHSQYQMKSFSDFENIGVGKALVCAANGYSLEENMHLLVKYKDNVDIMACDKSLGHLLRAGIRPKYCMVCDANVSFESYLKDFSTQLSDTILIQNVCGNPEWTTLDWKDRYFFVNQDVLKSEKEFSELSKCNNLIPAATNVSNAMVVVATQSNNEQGARNLFGYDKILLVGFDYNWRLGGKYYAFSRTGGGKANYMRHVYCFDRAGRDAYTSNNLLFSARWFNAYVKAFALPVVQCSKGTITEIPHNSDLETQLAYRYKPEDSETIRTLGSEIKNLKASLNEKMNSMVNLKNDHALKFLQTT
jgi:hypothetical protein